MQHAVHFRGMTGRGADERIIARGGSGEFDHCFAAWAAQGRRCEHALIIFRQPVVRFARGAGFFHALLAAGKNQRPVVFLRNALPAVPKN